ncbi:hypothetical protein SAMN02799624_03832 [Paenibacillus sp. UNC496MF]|nr:hypothetical protein SAMN02799624_03832 [Paenibacillus sp. UNC496MF]
MDAPVVLRTKVASIRNTCARNGLGPRPPSPQGGGSPARSSGRDEGLLPWCFAPRSLSFVSPRFRVGRLRWGPPGRCASRLAASRVTRLLRQQARPLCVPARRVSFHSTASPTARPLRVPAHRVSFHSTASPTARPLRVPAHRARCTRLFRQQPGRCASRLTASHFTRLPRQQPGRCASRLTASHFTRLLRQQPGRCASRLTASHFTRLPRQRPGRCAADLILS